MIKKRFRHIVCVVICISMLASQTLFSLGVENQSEERAASPATGSAVLETTPSEQIEPIVSDDDIDTDDNENLERDSEIALLESSEGQTLEDEIRLIELKTYDAVKDAEFDGYIVEIKEDSIDEIIEDEKEKAIETEVTENVVVVENPEDVTSFVSASAIENISPNYLLESYAYPDDTNDTYYGYQWGLKQAGINKIWKTGKTGAGVNVAIIDSGLNINHQDFDKTKVKVMRNLVDPDNPTSDISDLPDNPYLQLSPHGSFVTSIIAAKTNNKMGMAGITDQANIYFYKVFGVSPDGTTPIGGTTANLLAAYNEVLACNPKIDVLNLSLGHEGPNPTENALIKKIIDNGTIVIAAVGNEGMFGSPISYPANCPDVIGVGSIDENRVVSSFSSRNISVDVVAPGGNAFGMDGASNTGYVQGHGTSFASPLVAATAVAVKQMNKSVNAKTFFNGIVASSTDVGAAGRDNAYGYGILNVNALLNYFDKKTGWEYSGGHWYYFDKGVMKKGWLTTGGQRYYLNPNGTMATGWVRVANVWYLMNPSGIMLKGWQLVGRNWYFLASNGAMKTGWLRTGGQWYHLQSSGAMTTGWLKSGKTWYYLQSSGAMKTGWLKTGGKWYYLNSSGAMLTGSHKIGKKTYRFNSSGAWI